MLSKFKSLAVQIEAQEGVVEGGEAAGDLIQVSNATYNTDFQKIEREVAVNSLSPSKALPGPTRVNITFELEVGGPGVGSLAVSPPMGLLLRACGYREYGDDQEATSPWFSDVTPDDVGRAVYIDVAAVWTTGSQLNNGTILTGTTVATHTLRVIGTYFQGQTRIFCQVLSAATAMSGITTETAYTASGIDIPLAATGGPSLANRVYAPIDRNTYYLRADTAGAIGNLVGDVVQVGGNTFGFITEVVRDSLNDVAYLVERSPAYGFFASGNVVTGGSGGNFTLSQDPVQFDIPTLSLTFYEDGNRHRFRGCRGNAVYTWRPGEPGKLSFSMEGAFVGSANDVGFTPTTNIDDTPPERFVSATVTLDSVLSPLFSELTIDGGRGIAVSPDPSGANGIRVAQITSRAMTGNVDPEAVRVGEYAFHTRSRTAASVFIEGAYGTIGGARIHFFAPNVVFENLTPQDSDGTLRYTLPLRLYGKAPARGDEFVLAVL